MLVESRLKSGLYLLRNVVAGTVLLKQIWVEEAGKIVIARVGVGRICIVLEAT